MSKMNRYSFSVDLLNDYVNADEAEGIIKELQAENAALRTKVANLEVKLKYAQEHWIWEKEQEGMDHD